MRIKKERKKNASQFYNMYFVKDYRLFDKVRYQGRKNYLIERRTV